MKKYLLLSFLTINQLVLAMEGQGKPGPSQSPQQTLDHVNKKRKRAKAFPKEKIDTNESDAHLGSEANANALCESDDAYFRIIANSEALWHAVKSNDEELVNNLINLAELELEFTIDGKTPLTIALQNCNLRIIKMLLDKGANVNTQNKSASAENALLNQLIAADGTIDEVIFTNIRQYLIEFINREEKSIKIAIYDLNNKDITHALMKAHNRGVQIKIVADSNCANKSYSAIPKFPFPVWRYQETTMHNKFCIFKKNVNGRPLIWNGSFNFTTNASYNEENVTVRDNERIIAKFRKQFKLLKSNSIIPSKDK